jgi:Flp pilus assembly protein TadG
MRMRSREGSRRGAHAVESALVFPVVLVLFFGLIVGGIGIFRYQQVACLAQEAARWASVRGGDYQKDTDHNSPTKAQIRDQAVLPLAVSMDTSQLSVQVEWVDKGSNSSTDWDAAPKDVKSITPQGEYVNNTVRVTVTYNWSPGILIGPLTLSSQCEVPMSE